MLLVLGLQYTVAVTVCAADGGHTGVNPAGDVGDTSPPIFWLGGRQWEYTHQYFRVRSDIADQY